MTTRQKTRAHDLFCLYGMLPVIPACKLLAKLSCQYLHPYNCIAKSEHIGTWIVPQHIKRSNTIVFLLFLKKIFKCSDSWLEVYSKILKLAGSGPPPRRRRSEFSIPRNSGGLPTSQTAPRSCIWVSGSMPGCQRPRTDGPTTRPSGSAHQAAGEAALRSDPGAPPAIL